MATPAELAQFKSSEHYSIVDLMLEVHRYSDSPELGFFPIIGVEDKYGARTSTPDVLQNELNTQKETVERDRQEIVKHKTASSSSLVTIRQRAKDWKIKQSDKETYTVTGFGLGWLDSKLTSGQWIFHAGTGQMTPVNNEGIGLVNFLIAN
jgi:hypothetical protein